MSLAWRRAVWLLILSSACTTVTVRRIQNPNADEGLRYYLPQPFLLVTPQEDGSMTTEVVNIADPSQAYGVSATSYFAIHELSVKLNQGLLAEVALTVDETAVAAAAATAGGEIAKSRLEAEAEAEKQAKTDEKELEKEARTQAKEDRDAEKAAIKELESKLREAESKRKQLDAKVAEYELLAGQGALSQAANEAYRQAQVDAKAAAAEVEFLRAELSERRKAVRERSPYAPLNLNEVRAGGPIAPSKLEKSLGHKAEDPFQTIDRPGAMLFRIEEIPANGDDFPSVALVPVEFRMERTGPGPTEVKPQLTLPSYKGPKVDQQPDAGASSPKLTFVPGVFQVSLASGGGTLELQTNESILTIAVASFAKQGSEDLPPKPHWPTAAVANETNVALGWKVKIPTGTYTVSFEAVRKSDPAAEKKLTGEIQVEVK